MSKSSDPSRDLLFGLLALQNGLIDQGGLFTAFAAWTRDKGRPLADHLIELGYLDAARRAVVEAIAGLHVQALGGDPGKSLGVLSVGRSIREGLAEAGGPEVDATLGHVASAHGSTQEDDDPERTGSLSVGAATSDGQRFRILRPHARGGLGAVFVALDNELHREVALKQILEKHADDAVSRQRFVAEAEITGGLEHPGVVPVYGLGTDASGRPYYAMRFIKGDSLKDAIARFHEVTGSRELELRRLLRRFLDVCNAIDYAHSRGVIHRDLKPANIIVGTHGETLVVDWGLAKAVGRADPSVGEQTLLPSSSGSSETLPGSALGTPAYMSPEQARGELNRLGARSDVYSLGATLYCLQTGRPPFEGDDVGAILRAVQEGQFKPPSHYDPALDKALEAVCLKAMATQAEDRYPTPKALADDLDRWMADEPVTAWHEPIGRRARRWGRRNRTAVTAAAAALVAGVVGLSAVLAVQTQAKAVLAKSLNRERNAKTDLAKTNNELTRSQAAVEARYDLAVQAIKTFHTGVSEDFLLTQDQFKDVRDRLLESASDFYGKLGALLGTESDLASRRQLWQANDELANLTAKVGKPEDALAAHRQVLAARLALAAETPADPDVKADVGRSLTAVARLLETTGRTAEAEVTYRKAESLLVELAPTIADGGAARAVLADCRRSLGMFLNSTGHNDEAMFVLRLARADQDALATAPTGTAESLDNLARTIHNVANMLAATGKPAEAEAEFRQALAIRKKLADDNPAVAAFRFSLAAGHNAVGNMLTYSKPLEAEADLRTALAIRQKLVDDNPAVTGFRFSLAQTRSNLGQLFRQIGKSSEAEAEYRKALAITQKLADDNPNVTNFRSFLARRHVDIGRMLWTAGKSSEAEIAFREALAIDQKLADDNPAIPNFRRGLAESLLEFGWKLAQAGKIDDAIGYYTQEKAIRLKLAEASSATPHDWEALANCQINIADALRRLGRLEEALAACERSLAVAEPLVEAHPDIPFLRPSLGEKYLRLGQVRYAMENLAGAAAAWKRALANYDRSKFLTEMDTFSWACCHAVLAGMAGRPESGVSALEGADEAEKAIALLRRAVTLGYRSVDGYRTESALDPLRNRPDFQALMMDLGFPTDPFAR